MSRKNNRANRAPLRRIVSWRTDGNGRLIEQLECGHEKPRREDHYGPTNAARRRCRRCELDHIRRPDPDADKEKA